MGKERALPKMTDTFDIPQPPPLFGDHPATVTIMKYETADCSGTPRLMKLPAGVRKGSGCWSTLTYSVNNQYCDTDGKFKQTVYAGPDCSGNRTVQVLGTDSCMDSIKLAKCERPEASFTV